jgi:hypothetical protein
VNAERATAPRSGASKRKNAAETQTAMLNAFVFPPRFFVSRQAGSAGRRRTLRLRVLCVVFFVRLRAFVFSW